MADSTQKAIPCELRMSESIDRCIESVGVPYQEVIGSLIYLAIGTRPDIAYNVSSLSQHVKAPMACHWSGVKRIYRYLRAIEDLGIHYRYDEKLKITGFSGFVFSSMDLLHGDHKNKGM